MRKIKYILLFFFSINCKANNLCLIDEVKLLSFKVKTQKILSVCKGKNSAYLSYRFGIPSNIELQFPDKLDISSWKEFQFTGMRRGGGKQNAGFGSYSLSFTKYNVEYSIFQEWNDESEEYSIGVVISVEGKKNIVLNGIKKSQEGSLILLEDENKYIQNDFEKNIE
ncbi:MAG: hypothetical protein CTY18_04910 [Methylomonas sp.]|uniref:hypothetical protein n=1 Tax=Flavobacterium sp. TaxID=239 RepID=UPI000D26BD77|nr:hypothetical protein [Flavobacterium sp.]MBA4155673.1 hypothetical protein [Flavobacterium sp.]PPD36188.1 MAG: hypothetical protein CTY18_04910 [Methylomonas sp.]